MPFICQVDCPRCKAKDTVKVALFADPGVRTFRNGDPGYPGTTELTDCADADAYECTACHTTYGNRDIDPEWTEAEYNVMADQAVEKKDDADAAMWAEYDRMMDIAESEEMQDANYQEEAEELEQGPTDDEINEYGF